MFYTKKGNNFKLIKKQLNANERFKFTYVNDWKLKRDKYLPYLNLVYVFPFLSD